MRRAPARPLRACILRNCVLFHMSHLKFHFALHTSHCTLHTPHFTLHTPHFTLHTALFALHTSLHTALLRLHTSHFTLHASHFRLHSPHFTLLTAFFRLHTSPFTLHTSLFTLTLHSSRPTLHTALFTLHTSHSTLHTPHFISSELFSPYPSSSLLISSLLICHLSSHESLPSTTSRTCMRRAPARPVRACFVQSCCSVVVQEHDLRATPVQCNVKQTLSSHFTLYSLHPTLHTSHLHFISTHLI